MIYQDLNTTLYNQNFLDNDLPDESVQMVVTSPPYWGLRKYSGEQELVWLNGKNCSHDWITKEHKDTRGVEGSNLTGRIPYKEGEARINYVDGICSLCGAWKGAYGLEPTPDCGRPFMKLRDDLTPKQRYDTIEELKRLGVV